MIAYDCNKQELRVGDWVIRKEKHRTFVENKRYKIKEIDCDLFYIISFFNFVDKKKYFAHNFIKVCGPKDNFPKWL